MFFSLEIRSGFAAGTKYAKSGFIPLGGSVGNLDMQTYS